MIVNVFVVGPNPNPAIKDRHASMCVIFQVMEWPFGNVRTEYYETWKREPWK